MFGILTKKKLDRYIKYVAPEVVRLNKEFNGVVAKAPRTHTKIRNNHPMILVLEFVIPED